MTQTQDEQRYVCRVCGYRNPDHNPFYSENGGPEYGICACCGRESGYEDTTPEAAEMNRRRWIQEGTKWFHPELKPENWDLAEQLRRIGVELKDYQNN